MKEGNVMIVENGNPTGTLGTLTLTPNEMTFVKQVSADLNKKVLAAEVAAAKDAVRAEVAAAKDAVSELFKYGSVNWQ